MKKLQIRLFLFLIIVLSNSILYGQEDFPKGYFGPPLPIPLSLSGSFSELRNNHFHGGIDIRTNSQEGIPILAIADGFVSRVRVAGSGYGNMIFVEHPIGYTSVCTHLSRFAPQIAALIKEKQYEHETFEITLELGKDLFPVKKGDTIAFSGNSGHSLAPHLHFEIRETKSNWVINPLFCNFNLTDNIKPQILSVKIYPLDHKSAIKVEYNGKNGPYTRIYFKPVEFKTYLRNGEYVLSGVKQVFTTGNIGIAAEFRDQINGSGNILDIYSVDLSCNNKLIYRQIRKTFSLDDTRYINAHRDYEAKVLYKRQFQRLWVLSNNKISFYENLINRGIINLKEGDSIKTQITASDYFNNIVSLSFPMCYFSLADSLFPVESDTSYQKYFYAKRPNLFSSEGIELFFLENSFYEDLKFQYRKSPSKSWLYSDVHHIHNNKTPIQYPYTIRIKADKIPERLRSKALIAEVWNSSYNSMGGSYKDGYVEAKVKMFGSYAIMVDTLAPVVQTLNFWNNSNIAYLPEIRISIYDKLSGIKLYRATIDGKWILMEYDEKRNLLYHKFDEHTSKGEHIFNLVVTDEKDNFKEINLKFIR